MDMEDHSAGLSGQSELCVVIKTRLTDVGIHHFREAPIFDNGRESEKESQSHDT